LFAIVAASGLAFKKEKCVFAISELDFLARHISATVIAPSGTTSRSFYFDNY
jgi:tRNA A37 threonylcarbamoyladenosine modification protein TsaB